MVHQATFYPTPVDARITVTQDSQPDFPITAQPGLDVNGNQCQIAYIPDGTDNGQGVWLDVQAPGYVPLRLHGIMYLYDDGKAWTGYDIFVLTEAADAPDPIDPPPDPDNSTRSPQEIMAEIPAYLGSVEGCGIYCEDSCRALHDEHGPWWGHIRKDEAQHDYHGHAVDAVMLLVPTKGIPAGIYDIVKNSASPEAEKAFNYVEPPIPELWYYPETAYVLSHRGLIELFPRKRVVGKRLK